MAEIVLQFVRATDPLSNMIALYQRGWPSHVDAVLPDGQLLGARLDGGVAIRPHDYEHFDQKLVVRLDTAQAVRDNYYAWLGNQLGKPYDIKAILAFAALGRDWRDDEAWFCSELLAAGLEQCQFFPHPLSVTPNLLTPRDLLLVLSPFSWDASRPPNG